MKPKTRLTERQHEEPAISQEASTSTSSRSQPVEFATPEEALRHDRDRTAVPGGIPQRLAASLRAEPPPPPPAGWWHRLFRR